MALAPSREGIVLPLADALGSEHDPEIVWRMEDKAHHVGMIVRSSSVARVKELLASYVERVKRDFWAYAPPQDKPTH